MSRPSHVIPYFALLLLGAFLAACADAPPKTPFNGARAYADLERVLSYGPRTPGSAASRQTREYIRAELDKAGISLEEQPFMATTPIGAVTMTNLVAKIPGDLPGVIIIGNHYDTKIFPDFEFVGANDGGSTTAWMIEFARAVGPKRSGHTLWLCWFDGEESYREWTAEDSLYGSRAMVERLREARELGMVRAMINVDMIGDCDLGVEQDEDAPAHLVETIWTAATQAGHRKYFTFRAISIDDDHKPFREAGIPAIDLIDFQYGGNAVEHQMNWHTARDTIDRVCPESLQAVGDVMLMALPALDRNLGMGGGTE